MRSRRARLRSGAAASSSSAAWSSPPPDSLADAGVERRDLLGRGAVPGKVGAEFEALELGLGGAEFGQSDLAAAQDGIVEFDDFLAVHETGELLLPDADADAVPFPRPVGLGGNLLEDGPRQHVGPLEAGEPEVPAARVEPVVFVGAVRGEDQPGRPGFVVEPHLDGDLVGRGRDLALVDAQGAAAEARAGFDDGDAAGALLPPRPHDRLPTVRVELADGQPFAHGDGVGFLQQAAEAGHRDREAEVVGHRRLHVQQAAHPALGVEERAAAVARLDGDGELDVFRSLDLAQRGNHPADDAELEPVGVAHGDDIGALGDLLIDRQLERLQALRVDAQDRQVEFPVPGVDGGHVVGLAVIEADGDRARFADDVRAGGDEAVLGDHKAAPGPGGAAVAALLGDHDHRGSGGGGEVGGRLVAADDLHRGRVFQAKRVGVRILGEKGEGDCSCEQQRHGSGHGAEPTPRTGHPPAGSGPPAHTRGYGCGPCQRVWSTRSRSWLQWRCAYRLAAASLSRRSVVSQSMHLSVIDCP